MGRKMGFMGRKMDDLEVEELTHVPDPDRKEHLTYTGPADWSPEQAEQYIDWRIQQVEAEISRLREQLEVETAKRRRWLSVTGGRSKLVANGSGNGNANGNGNGNGHGTASE
jgi:hypothetical protein